MNGSNKKLKPLGAGVAPSITRPTTITKSAIITNSTSTNSSSSQPEDHEGPRKTVIRSGGGRKWEDSTLLEWDPTHFRLFVGNLGGEATDDTLKKAFSKYPSVSKTKVIRDQKAGKNKGYGFVAFKDSADYFTAFKEMNGKYIGSHPVLLRKAQTEINHATVLGKKQYSKATSKILMSSSEYARVGKKRKIDSNKPTKLI
ncbi:uncharacterized protein V1516DRAFT_673256 [Lipomyces oligophaga]|uniref:uncharacterized protein n=1 Tax=Lipomyces oligophaga TaxID=45792 RepID=UPI0034CF4A31